MAYSASLSVSIPRPSTLYSYSHETGLTSLCRGYNAYISSQDEGKIAFYVERKENEILPTKLYVPFQVKDGTKAYFRGHRNHG